MAAADNLHPKQLAMFMPARELYGMHSLDSYAHGGDVDQMRRGKRRVNAVGKLPDSIGKEGVRKPVSVVHDLGIPEMHGETVALANGNHRVIAAYDRNPAMEIPVEHYDTEESAMDAVWHQDYEEKW
jgi:hypothetical protein